jgi:hypothetical protein
MVKIVCVHTGAGPGIFGTMEEKIKKRINCTCQISHITNPGIIAEVAEANGVTEHAVLDLLNMYTVAVNSGADIILNMCSSVGDVADAAAPLLSLAGTHIIRIDHRMCEEAATKYNKIDIKYYDEPYNYRYLISAKKNNDYYLGVIISNKDELFIDTSKKNSIISYND